MKCILSSLTRVKPICTRDTVCRVNLNPQVLFRTQALPSVAILPTSGGTHISSSRPLSGSYSSRPMQSSAAAHSRRLHVAAGQGALERPFEEMPPHELQEILERMSQDGADDIQLIDVREDFEHQTASLPGFKLMPMSRLQEWAQDIHDEMDADKETVLLCHMGVRSRHVAGFLASQGFTKLRNVTGGIDAYSKEVDSSVPVY